jgi:hypothetical protein
MGEEGGMFPQHPRNTEWETLEGRMLAPHTQDVLESVAQGDSRHQDAPANIGWDTTILVNTGTTGAGGAMAK